MAGKRVEIVWAAEDTPETLGERYRRQEDGEVRTRLHALWLLRRGWGMPQVAEIVGVHYRTVQRWVGWYRHGGVGEVCAIMGVGRDSPPGSPQSRKPPKGPSLPQQRSGGG
jgi:hypothetical protein